MVLAADPRTKRNIRSPFDVRRQQNRQLRRAIAVVSVEENQYVRIVRPSQAGQAGASVSAPWFADDLRAPTLSDLWRSVTRIAVDNDDLCDQIGRQIGEHAANRLRFVMSRNDDGHSHASPMRPRIWHQIRSKLRPQFYSVDCLFATGWQRTRLPLFT